ncbi:MAG: hypothetical protein ACFNZX_03160, partial [Actinomyces sp.]
MSTRRRTAPILVVASAAAALALSACTAHMDLTISESDTYDATIVMRDTTGSVLTADTDCQSYADPSVLGSVADASVSAVPVGSANDDAGVGCEVTATGVKVPD